MLSLIPLPFCCDVDSLHYHFLFLLPKSHQLLTLQRDSSGEARLPGLKGIWPMAMAFWPPLQKNNSVKKYYIPDFRCLNLGGPKMWAVRSIFWELKINSWMPFQKCLRSIHNRYLCSDTSIKKRGRPHGFF